MYIKRFMGSSVKDAMKAVKAEFNDNALILGTKKIRSAPDALFEVTVAVEHDFKSPGVVGGGTVLSGAHVGAVKEAPARAKGNTASGAILQDAAIESFLKKELGELRELFWTIAGLSETEASSALKAVEEELVSNGVDRRLARTILEKASAASDKSASDVSTLRECVKRTILDNVSIADPLRDSGVVAFVGPTGVGKTTTIAKLAAINALKMKRSVALLTMDTYRIAAVEQLRVYAKIIGVPVDVAKTADELNALVAKYSDKDLILIDTAGRGKKNTAHLKELAAIHCAHRPVRYNLVLGVQARDSSLFESVRHYSKLGIHSLSFTKLDESDVCAQMLNVMAMARRPIAYLTAGQRVPEDIELATKERLLSFALGDGGGL